MEIGENLAAALIMAMFLIALCVLVFCERGR